MFSSLATHLWQSTFFALAAALLTAAFRKNRAQARYWLWLSASLKFFIPFALLFNLGRYLETWMPAAHQIAAPAVSYTIEQFSAPFFPNNLPSPQPAPDTIHWIPIAILALWLAGFITVASIRFRGWRKILAAMRTSTVTSIAGTVQIRVSPVHLEPGVVGIVRPVLLLPEGIAERLSASELEAVIAHELCHVRRRDNLFATLHMIVEAAFWFHPLVWWISGRLVEERERACDEEVLSQGNHPEVYADAIFNVCKLYAQSPLACVSGVSGASIRRRIEAIMTDRTPTGLNRAKKFLLAAAGPVAIGLLIGAGNVPIIRAQSLLPRVPALQIAQMPTAPTQAPAPTAPPEFDAASIRPNKDSSGGGRGGPADGPPLRFTPGKVMNPGLGGATARRIIFDAYRVLPYQVSGGPAWVESDRFNLEAVSASATNEDQLRLMLQSLLSQRFKLRVHHESKTTEVYALMVAKSGLKLHELKEGDPEPSQPETFTSAAAKLLTRAGTPTPVTIYPRVTMQSLAGRMATNRLANLDLPVVDKTGLNGHYDFAFEWDPNEDYKAAVEEQLGLKFVPQKDVVDILVIDSIERPSEN